MPPRRTLQEKNTTRTPAEVLAEAKVFFARQNLVYAAFIEQEGPTHLSLRGQGGEEIVMGVPPGGGGTQVTASSYLFDQQVARFLGTLPPVPLLETAPLPAAGS